MNKISFGLRFQQTLLQIGLRILALFPLTWLQRFARLLGRILYYFPNDIRRVTRLNIEHCFPDWTPAQREDLIRRSIQHTLMSAMEMVALWIKPPAFSFRQIRNGTPLPPLTGPEGHLFLVPHMGAWEIFTVSALEYYSEVVSLYRPPKKMILEKIIRNARQRTGMTMVPTTQTGVKALFKALDQNKVVAILPDQDPGESGGVFVPFFGLDAWTMTLAVRLAHKSKAKVYFAFATRNAIGEGFDTHVIPASEGIFQDDLTAATASMSRDLEAIVRQFPDQYQWAYKRFKRQPGGKPNFYDTMRK